MRPMTPFGAAVSRAGLALFAALVAIPAASAPARSASSADVAPKPVAPISIRHEFGSDPIVGMPLDLALSIVAESDLNGIVVTLGVDDPLALIEPVGAVELGSLAAGEEADIAVTVLPLVDQTHYLGVTVTATINGVPQTRSVSVPVRMSVAGQRKAEEEPASQKAEEHLRSFEAIETIR